MFIVESTMTVYFKYRLKDKFSLERAVDGALSQTITLKCLPPPAPKKPTPGA